MIRSSHLQEAAETIELQGVEIEDLKGQLRKIKTMLTQHKTTLMGMENTGCMTDSRILKALQAFILDIMDAAEIPDHAHVGVIGADSKHGAADMLADVEADEEIEITPKKSKAELAGDQVVDILTKVYRLENQGKMEAARSLRASLPDVKALGESAINKASRDFEDRLFRIGGLKTITTTMERILSRPLIRQVSLFSTIQQLQYWPQVSWTLRDAFEGEIEATFPELEVNFVVSDGAMSQVKISKSYTLAY